MGKKISSEDYEKKYLNKIIGNMIVTGYGYYKNNRHFVKTKCLRCGEESIRRVDRKNHIYCKICQKDSHKQYNHLDTSFNQHVIALKNNAKSRNLDFKLNNTEIKKLISNTCYYCGAMPSELSYSYYGNKHNKNSGYLANGIDRLNSNKGYTLDNCVTCCSVCNLMKNKFSTSEFFEKIKLIYNKHFVITFND